MSFESGQSYWVFSQEVIQSNRYIYSDAVKNFLSNVLETGEARVTPVSSGNVFWRAQLGSNSRPVLRDSKKVGDDPVPFSDTRMKPLQDQASEGRVNPKGIPKGIPCLYLATDKETAMSEVRPWPNSRISVGEFKTVKKLRLIDCSKHPSGAVAFYEGEPDEQKKAAVVWAGIDRAFSRPVAPSDKALDYVPTQILAELFKNNGFDGVCYKSSLAGGSNVALFDIHAATMVNCWVYRVEKVECSFGGPLLAIGQ